MAIIGCRFLEIALAASSGLVFRLLGKYIGFEEFAVCESLEFLCGSENKVLMRIRSIHPSKAKRWDEFVRNHSKGTVLHLSNWAKVPQKTYGLLS